MKFNNKNVISFQQFKEMHPRGLVSQSDLYYVALANQILQTLLREKLVTNKYEHHLLKKIALHSAFYAEDVISEAGLFLAFRNICQRLCGRKLPFLSYSDDEYFDKEINLPDVQILVWCILQEYTNKTTDNGICFMNPDNPMLAYISTLIMSVLEEEYETAPANGNLHNLLHNNKIEDYLQLRGILQWLHYDSYLSMQYPKYMLAEEMEDIQKNEKEFTRKQKEMFFYDAEVTGIYTGVCSPLAIKAVDWLKEITTNQQLKTTLDTIEVIPYSTYEIMHRFDKEIKVCPIDNANKILYVDAKSADDKKKWGNEKNMTTTLVKFNNLWHINGIVLTGENGDNFVVEMEKAKKEKNQMEENARYTYETIMKYTKNKPFVFFKKIDEYIDFWKKVFPSIPNLGEFENNCDFQNSANLALFVEQKKGTTVIPDVASWIKLPYNKLYDKAEASEDAVSIFLGATMATLEVITYLIENNLLPDASVNSSQGEKRDRQLVQENQWFLVRFFQPDLFY